MLFSLPWTHRLLLSLLLASVHVAGQEQALFSLEQPTIYAAVNSSTINCERACVLIQEVLGQQNVYYGALPDEFSRGYYSMQQQELRPICVAALETAQQIAQAITIVKDEECPFAVKSGGHTPYAGASNVQDGLVFDLRNLNTVELSEDKLTVSVGSGNRWIDVYTILERHGLAVAGGRVASVGVSGFLLGGGLSLHNRKYGWAVNNVRNFEVVLSDGIIANVNADSHPDLFWALRGGGGNFGIVTRFDLETFPQGLIWAGTEVVAISDLASRRAALNLHEPFQWTLRSATNIMGKVFHQGLCLIGKCVHSNDFINYFVGMSQQTDTNAHILTFFCWMPEVRMIGLGGSFAYLEPVEKPQALENMTALKTFYSTVKLRTMSDFTKEMDSYTPPIYRAHWDTTTFKVNADLISKLFDIFLEETHEIKNIPNCQPSTNNQLITKDDIVLSDNKGGNPMGIKAEDGPLFLFSITITYTDPADDVKIKTVAQKVMSRAKALGKEMGLHLPFQYKNYADGDTDVYAGYGTENRQKLKDIQKKYDAAGVFSRLQSGSHKV